VHALEILLCLAVLIVSSREHQVIAPWSVGSILGDMGEFDIIVPARNEGCSCAAIIELGRAVDCSDANADCWHACRGGGRSGGRLFWGYGNENCENGPLRSGACFKPPSSYFIEGRGGSSHCDVHARCPGTDHPARTTAALKPSARATGSSVKPSQRWLRTVTTRPTSSPSGAVRAARPAGRRLDPSGRPVVATMADNAGAIRFYRRFGWELLIHEQKGWSYPLPSTHPGA
jgi:hypothetical protein